MGDSVIIGSMPTLSLKVTITMLNFDEDFDRLFTGLFDGRCEQSFAWFKELNLKK